MSGAYLGVLIEADSVGAQDVVASWITLVAVIVPVAVGLRVVRGGVTQLVRSLAEAARSDPLTQLKNRLALDQEVYEQLEVARRGEGRLTVVVGDLDHFKWVNDQLGHRAGDRALVRVARILASHRRAGDTVARTGGEEFTLLLPNSSEHDAYLAAERLRTAVASEFESDPVPLTFSFGVATFPDHGGTADAVIESADQALYAAKALGRNRSIIFNREISAIFAPEGGGRGLDASHLPTLLTLTEALDIRDAGTANHSRTVGRYCALIAEQLGMPPDHVERIEMAGRLHDIGKIGVPNAVLQKPGPLGSREMAQVRTHPEIGAEVLAGKGLEDLRSWVVAHHERPDGKGYPERLTDAEIPVEAKIIAVADAYEAMTADRVYRTGIGSKAARVELLRCAGTQFDARVIAAFMGVLDAHRAGARHGAGRPQLLTPVKRSVSLVIEGPGGVLLVRRPDDDDSLPGLWGLPAASLAEGESERDALVRVGRDKLGVEVEPLEPVGEDEADRVDHRIAMRDWSARIVAGQPAVPQSAAGTQYVEWRWGDPAELAPAARAGSVCARVLLRALGSSW